jgi:hypothetical protein
MANGISLYSRFMGLSLTLKVAIVAVVGVMVISFAMCASPKKSEGINPSGATTTAQTATETSNDPDLGMPAPSDEDMKDPSYSEVSRMIKEAGAKYWNDRFTKCDEGRWFSAEETTSGTRYLEIRSDRLGALAPFVFTTPPTRFASAQRYNREWFAKSVVRGNAFRWCAEAGECGNYQELFGGQYSILDIHIEKGKLTINDPAPNLYPPKSCDEIRRHPIFKLP